MRTSIRFRSLCGGPSCVHGPLPTFYGSLRRTHQVSGCRPNGIVLRTQHRPNTRGKTFVNSDLGGLCLTQVWPSFKNSKSFRLPYVQSASRPKKQKQSRKNKVTTFSVERKQGKQRKKDAAKPKVKRKEFQKNRIRMIKAQVCKQKHLPGHKWRSKKDKRSFFLTQQKSG